MQAKKKSTGFLQVAVCFFFIFLTTPCDALNEKNPGNDVKVYKITSEQPSQIEPEPETKPISENEPRTETVSVRPGKEIVFVVGWGE